jgi:hypothetical protein
MKIGFKMKVIYQFSKIGRRRHTSVTTVKANSRHSTITCPNLHRHHRHGQPPSPTSNRKIMSEYEKLRAKNVLRNQQLLEELELGPSSLSKELKAARKNMVSLNSKLPPSPSFHHAPSFLPTPC